MGKQILLLDDDKAFRQLIAPVLEGRGHTVVQANDRVVLFAPVQAVKKVEKMFSVRLEYF